MKRIISLLALFLALVTLSGCSLIDGILGGSGSNDLAPFTVEERDPISLPSAKPADVSGSEAEPAPEPETLDPAALLNELMFHIDLLNACYAETCGAQFDRSIVYRRVYANDDAIRNNEAPIDVVPDGSISLEETHDPTWAELHEITNFKTNDEALAYLKQYMAPELAEKLFPNQFLEMNGKLYMVYGSRGYGEYQLDAGTAVISDVTAESCTVTLDGVVFEERLPCTIEFTNTNGVWMIASVTDNGY